MLLLLLLWLLLLLLCCIHHKPQLKTVTTCGSIYNQGQAQHVTRGAQRGLLSAIDRFSVKCQWPVASALREVQEAGFWAWLYV